VQTFRKRRAGLSATAGLSCFKFCGVTAILQKSADSQSLKRNNLRTNRARGLKFFVYTSFCVLLEYGVVIAVSHLDVAQRNPKLS